MPLQTSTSAHESRWRRRRDKIFLVVPRKKKTHPLSFNIPRNVSSRNFIYLISLIISFAPSCLLTTRLLLFIASISVSVLISLHPLLPPSLHHHPTPAPASPPHLPGPVDNTVSFRQTRTDNISPRHLVPSTSHHHFPLGPSVPVSVPFPL